MRFDVRSTRALGSVTIELLDHHGVLMAGQTRAVGAQSVRFAIKDPSIDGDDDHERRYPEMVHVRVGAFHAWERARYGMRYFDAAFGGMKTARSVDEAGAE
jgi:hypothetical protein